jgi:hypothetical protein
LRHLVFVLDNLGELILLSPSPSLEKLPPSPTNPMTWSLSVSPPEIGRRRAAAAPRPRHLARHSTAKPEPHGEPSFELSQKNTAALPFCHRHAALVADAHGEGRAIPIRWLHAACAHAWPAGRWAPPWAIRICALPHSRGRCRAGSGGILPDPVVSARFPFPFFSL